MKVLQVEGVTKTFPSMTHPALSDVSFSLEQGRCLGIVGGSGSGKSTLARTLMMLERPDRGSVLLFGEETAGLSGRRRKSMFSKIQMVFQTPIESFDPQYSLGSSIAEFGRSFGMSRVEAKGAACEKLSMVGLDETFFDRRPSEVSGGQCQRAALARALMVDPSVLVCDEITSALDVTTQARIVSLVAELKKTMTVVFITHDLALASNLSDKLLVMHEGKIVEQGETGAVISNPQSRYTLELLSAFCELNGALDAVCAGCR